MNYFAKHSEFIDLVLKLLGSGFGNPTKVNIGVSYSQTKRLSTITIEVSPSAVIHSLIFFYTRGLTLYDAISL